MLEEVVSMCFVDTDDGRNEMIALQRCKYKDGKDAALGWCMMWVVMSVVVLHRYG